MTRLPDVFTFEAYRIPPVDFFPPPPPGSFPDVRDDLEATKTRINDLIRALRSTFDQVNTRLLDIETFMEKRRQELIDMYVLIAASVNALEELGPLFLFRDVIGVSYFGGTSATTDFLIADMADFASRQITGVRTYATWDVATAVNPDGSLGEEPMNQLARICGIARQLNMSVAVVMDRGRLNSLEAHQAGAALLAEALVAYRNVYFDLGADHNVAGSGFVSPDEIVLIAETVRDVDPERTVTASAAGDPATIAEVYVEELSRGADWGLITPHFPQDAEWDDEAENRVIELRETMLVDDFARQQVLTLTNEIGDPDTGNVDDFFRAARRTIRGGAIGWFYDDRSGDDLTTTRYFDQISAQGLAILDGVVEAIATTEATTG